MNYKPLRDAVYGYVYFTPLEAIIIEHPIFQRLRFIYQNSTAYLTYPANQLTRFSHSLGVMHMGGDLFLRSFKNFDQNHFPQFVEDLSQFVKQFLFDGNAYEYDAFAKAWNDSYENIGEFTNRFNPSFRTEAELSNLNFILGFTWQSVRLACLIHDIGHFPFSHVFELGIDLFQKQLNVDELNPIINFKKKIALEANILDDINNWKTNDLHEYFGLFILSNLVKKDENAKPDEHVKSDENAKPELAKVLRFATEIFGYKSEENYAQTNSNDKRKIVQCLHSIVSSNIDADRLDYTLRDTLSSGLNVGDFDYKRIINNTVIKKEYIDSTGYTYNFYITSKALSSIEQFINLRYLLYQHLIYHHNVSKYDAIYVQIISKILSHAFQKLTPSIVEILERYRFIDKTCLFPDSSIETYDDAWFRTMLQEIQRSKDLEEIDMQLKFLLRTALYRESQHTVSFFKTPSDLDYALSTYLKDWYNKNFKEIKHNFKGANFHEVFHWDLPTILRFLFRHLKLEEISKNFLRDVDRDITTKFPKVIFIWKKTIPKLVSNSESIWHGLEKKKILNLSPYIRNISNVEKFTFNHYFGIVGKNIKYNKDVIDDCKEILFKHLETALTLCWNKQKEEFIEEED